MYMACRRLAAFDFKHPNTNLRGDEGLGQGLQADGATDIPRQTAHNFKQRTEEELCRTWNSGQSLSSEPPGFFHWPYLKLQALLGEQITIWTFYWQTLLEDGQGWNHPKLIRAG